MTKVQRPIVHGRDHEHGGADPIRVHWESVGEGGGGGISSFALRGGWFATDLTTTPLVLDTPTPGPMHFYTADPGTFDSNAGRARIVAPGFYVIGCQTNWQTLAAITADTYVHLRLSYQDDVGYGVEIPWRESGFFSTGMHDVEEIKGTAHIYPSGTSGGLDIGLQRLHPISLTEAMTFPVEITPTAVTNAAADTVYVTQLGLWGFRLGGALDSEHSD